MNTEHFTHNIHIKGIESDAQLNIDRVYALHMASIIPWTVCIIYRGDKE